MIQALLPGSKPSSGVAIATIDPKLQPSCPRIGSPSSLLPCMLMRKERPVLNRARRDYPAPLHFKSHMHWHLLQVMTQLLSTAAIATILSHTVMTYMHRTTRPGGDSLKFIF